MGDVCNRLYRRDIYFDIVIFLKLYLSLNSSPWYIFLGCSSFPDGSSFLTAGNMVRSSSSRSRSTKRSPERRKSPAAAPEGEAPEPAVPAPETDRKDTDAVAEKKDGKQRTVEKRSKGSGAVAHRRKKGDPGTWTCFECQRVIQDNPIAKQQHWDSVYCRATRLYKQHGGDWWHWRAKLEKEDVAQGGWTLQERPNHRGRDRPPEPKVPPRGYNSNNWEGEEYYDRADGSKQTDRERSSVRGSHRSRSRDRRRGRSCTPVEERRRKYGEHRERARSSGRNRARSRATRDEARKPKSRKAEYEEVVEEFPSGARGKSGTARSAAAPAAAKEVEKTPEEKKEKEAEREEDAGSSDYSYTYESPSRSEGCGKDTGQKEARVTAPAKASAKAGFGKTGEVVKASAPAAAPVPVAGSSASAPATTPSPRQSAPNQVPGTETASARLSDLYTSLLRAAMQVVHDTESQKGK